MSAWIVSRKHIAYLVLAATRVDLFGEPLTWTWRKKEHRLGREGYSPTAVSAENKELEKLGNMLWQECIKSVKARYGGQTKALPGSGKDSLKPFKVSDIPVHYPAPFDWAQVIMSCRCYGYQSCEHKGWKRSQAKSFCEALESAATEHLLRSFKCAWGVPKWLAPEETL